MQFIKPPTLLEIDGPLFMSSPGISHVLYRLPAEGGGTRVKFRTTIGQIGREHLDGAKVNTGWTSIISRIRCIAENRIKETNS